MFAIFQLADELNASPSDFTVLSYDEGTWPSAAYGCPAPGMFYAQGEMDGWSFQIGYQDQVFEFHAGKNDVQGDTLVNCTKNEDLLEGTINPVELAGLDSTTKIEVRRINSEGGYTLKSTVTDPEDIQEIINVLNVPVALSPAVSCTPTVEMAFTTDDGEQVLHAICSGQTRLLRGDQGFWNGMDATVPIQFQSVIGPYLATDDLPPPPTPLPGSPTVTAGQ